MVVVGLALAISGAGLIALHEQVRRRADLRARLRLVEAELELMHHAEWLLASNQIEARA